MPGRYQDAGAVVMGAVVVRRGEGGAVCAPARGAVASTPPRENEEDAEPVIEAYDERVLPSQIDTARMTSGLVSVEQLGDYLGSLEWTPEWTRYIGRALPRNVEATKALRRAWWANTYLTSRIEARLGPVSTNALIVWLRDDIHYGAVTRTLRQDRHWLEGQRRQAGRIVKEYLPDNSPLEV